MTKNTVAIKKGDRLTFKGYTDLGDGMEPLFEAGDTLIAAEVTQEKNGDVKVKAFKEGGDADDMDTLFYPDEIEVARVAKAPSAKTKAAPKAEEPEEAAEAEEAEEAEDLTEEAEEAPVKAKAKSATKTKPAPAPARTQEEADQLPIHHTKTVAKLLKKADGGDGILEAAKALRIQGEQTKFNLGGVLAEIQSKKSYVAAGYTGDSGWQDYLLNELNVEYRSAMYYIEIYKTCSELGIDEERIANIGWTKLRSVVKVARKVTDKQLDKLLEKASKLTRDELDAYISKNFVGSGAASERISKVVYKFTAMGDEAEYINASVARAQELVEGGDVNSALKHIVREWAMMADGVELKLEDAIKAVETRFGVKLAVAGEPEAQEAEEVEEKVTPAKKSAAASKTKKASAKRK